MEALVFSVIVLSELLLGTGLILSLLKPNLRVWPPPGRGSWQQILVLALTAIAVVVAIPLGILDRGSLPLGHWAWIALGGLLAVAGMLFALWGTISLSVHISLGLERELITNGAYRYSRNPQYVGWGAFFVGYALVLQSLLTLVAGAIGVLLFVITVFAEEPWLRERYGPPYDTYRAQVPRFLGLPRKGGYPRS